jgi:metal-responsive CopG/Arc/MetJ family transcriptional regulator
MFSLRKHMSTKTVVLGLRVPEDLMEDIEKAKKITGALSVSDLLREALRAYLTQLSLISDRAQKIKNEGRKEAEPAPLSKE